MKEHGFFRCEACRYEAAKSFGWALRWRLENMRDWLSSEIAVIGGFRNGFFR